MRKLLWVSDNPLIPTGYAQVTRNVGTRLRKAGYDFNALACQQWSQPIYEAKLEDGWINFPIKPSIHFGENYGNKGSITHWQNALQPHATIFLLDPFMLNFLVEKKVNGNIIEREIDKMKQRNKLWFYFPFDSADVYSGADSVLKEMDVRIAMSQFGQKLLKDKTDLDSYYIPHGVDTNLFRRYSDKVRDQFRKQAGLEGKFVIGSVFRNQTRKMPTKMLDAFKIFSEGKKDAVLLMHTDPFDPQGHNLGDYINRIGIDKEKVKFTNMSFINGQSQVSVNHYYNMMDIHTLSTTGEGFGLPIIESQACGVPNVVTNYTTSKELIEGHGQLVDLLGGDRKGYIEGQLNTKRAIIDVDHMAECFQRYYDDRALLKRDGENAMKFTIENYTWEKVTNMWMKLFEDLL